MQSQKKAQAMVLGALPLARASVPALVFPRAVQSFMPRADVNDPAKILADLAKNFDDFKAANDERLKAVEGGRPDPLQAEKVARIDASVGDLQAAIDELTKKLAAQQLNGGGMGGGVIDTPERREHASAFNTYFRAGERESELNALAIKASMTRGSDPDGGYLAPAEIDLAITRVLQVVSSMRALARVRSISTGVYKKLVSLGGAGAGWTAETGARPATSGANLSQLDFEAMELYANPFASQTLLDDAQVDLASWLAEEVSITFAEQEGAAFITGNGVGKPRGILGYAPVADGSYAWGNPGYIATTGAAGFAAANALDQLITLIYAIKQGYRVNANWLMNRKTVGVVRTFKDTTGNYLWQPSNQVGQPATLMNYPTHDDDNMPDVAANAYPIAFGDFQRAYQIVDRMGVRVLRDPFTNKPFVGFYTTKRVGGGIQNFEALKLLKCAVS